jgi:hypothetical protein
MISEEEAKKNIGLPGDEKPVIEIGSGSKMPETPVLESIEGLEDVQKGDPFLTPFGSKL